MNYTSKLWENYVSDNWCGTRNSYHECLGCAHSESCDHLAHLTNLLQTLRVLDKKDHRW